MITPQQGRATFVQIVEKDLRIGLGNERLRLHGRNPSRASCASAFSATTSTRAPNSSTSRQLLGLRTPLWRPSVRACHVHIHYASFSVLSLACARPTRAPTAARARC